MKIKYNPKSLLNINRTTHGMRHTRPYTIWKNMKARCNNSNNPDYHLYGGRGIIYDPKWQTFEGFWEDMKEEYQEKLSLDRIDSNGNYEFKNCRWTTFEQQANNSRRNHFFTFQNKTLTLTQWARELKISYIMIKKRIIRGWSIEKALTIPKLK